MTSSIRDVRELLGAAKEVSPWLKGEKTESLRLDCLNNLGIYTSTVQTGNAFARWVRGLGKGDLKLPRERVYNVKVFELKPTGREIKEAVQRRNQELVVDFKKCLNSEMFRLEIQYRMQDDFLHSIVHARSSPEDLGEETTYHLSAQLTDPQSLVKGFSEVDIEDYPVTARIYVKENIDTVLPGLETFKEIRRIEAEMLKDYDPRHGTKMIGLQQKRYTLRRRLLQENPQEALRTLIGLLRPTRFLRYLRIEEDFRLHRCAWGIEKLEMPGSVFLPENMDVVTRADLRLDKPAARGTLHYQAGQFTKDVKEALQRGQP